MAENDGDQVRRSSSQTSDASADSKKARAARTRPRKGSSKSSSTPSQKHDPSLTSFPSLSPDSVDPKSSPIQSGTAPRPSRTISQKARDRRTTLAGLTSASPSVHGRETLFDDSPRIYIGVPGALHLASDEHIERLLARHGAVKLVRQFAQDLAQRDAEISALRVRADDRERELKKMLREVEVSSAIIEGRLYNLEHPGDDHDEPPASPDGLPRKLTNTIDAMMQQAMSEAVGLEEESYGDLEDVDPSATVRPIKARMDKSTDSSGDSTMNKINTSKVWQVLWTGSGTSQGRSASSSLLSQDAEELENTLKLTASNQKTNTSLRTGIDSILQAPTQSPTHSSSYFIGGASKTVKKSKAADDASVHSKQSTRSITSWTKIFAGSSPAVKEQANKPRASSLDFGSPDGSKTSDSAAESAMAALSRTHTNPVASSASKSNISLPSSGAVKARQNGPVPRAPSSSNLSLGQEHSKPDSLNTANLGPVEMDAILPMDSKPPTMHVENTTYQTEGLLTDRFGFIYDQRQRKRQREASMSQKNRLSGVESLKNFRNGSTSEDDGSIFPKVGTLPPARRPTTPGSVEEEVTPKKWQDYLKVSNLTRPTELLSHTPSAGAIVTVSTADATGTMTPPGTRASSISVGSQKAHPSSSHLSEPSQSSVTATSELSNSYDPAVPLSTSATDQEPVKLLLDQLTELHDALQTEKALKWNEFLRKVRAERNTSASSSSDRLAPNAPEADILNGELIGIASLGRPKKANRAKYVHFKALVLAGIPVSLRPKIWSECSGAASLRIPGYYEDLVARSEAGDGVDTEIASQIAVDIGRTLTDNIFFRHGPGVQRLREILLAYSLHNPRVGYCQGMNLITGSLLLVCATPEESFWILVAIIDNILPSGYFDRGLLVSRADQIVLREYVGEVLPKLGSRLEDLGVELEACSFMWYLSLFTGLLSAEALFRVWDVVLCLNSSDTPPAALTNGASGSGLGSGAGAGPSAPTTPVNGSFVEGESQLTAEHDGTCSPFLFQLSLALLKLNEAALLRLDSAAQIYTYCNHSMTNHAISIDGLISASEALRRVVVREDVLARRARAVKEIGG